MSTSLSYQKSNHQKTIIIPFIDQRHVLAESYRDWRGTDLEWFFSETTGILGIDGKAKTNPKVISSYQLSFMKSFKLSQCVYVSEILEGIPQICWEPSGLDGWLKHLDVPYTRYLLKYSHLSSYRANKESLVRFSEASLG